MLIKLLDDKYVIPCLNLQKESIGSSWSENQWRRELQNTNNFTYGCFELKKKSLIAFINGFVISDELNINSIVVEKHFQRKGIGRLILFTALERNSTKGINKIILEVNVNNIPAMNFYRRLGFKTINIRRNYYNDGSDAETLALAIK